jgi:hypothetical protein
VTIVDENDGDIRKFNGITDDTHSEVQGFSVSSSVNVSKLCFLECVLTSVWRSQCLNSRS